MEELLERLREARESSSLSQRTVAERMGTSQPAVARLERGGADPRLGTIVRYAKAVGAQVQLVSDAGVDIPARADAVTEALDAGEGDVSLAFRHVIQLLDDLNRLRDDPDALAVSLRREPPRTGDRRFDALIAAVCERVAHQAGLPVAGWTAAPSRFLERWWFPVADLLGRLPEGLACYALANSPPEFAVRGIFVDPDSLESA